MFNDIVDTLGLADKQSMIETITINRNPSDGTYKNRDEMLTVVAPINFIITLKDGYIFDNNTSKQTWSTVDKDFASSSSSQTDIISSYSNSTTNSTLTISTNDVGFLIGVNFKQNKTGKVC